MSDIEITYETATSELILKIVFNELLGMARSHTVHNIAFIYDGQDLYYEGVDETCVDNIENCVHIIPMDSVDLRAVEHVFPKSFEAINLALYYHEVFDKFPLLEDLVQEAGHCLCDGAPENAFDFDFAEDFDD
jgi:hypothetical protein